MYVCVIYTNIDKSHRDKRCRTLGKMSIWKKEGKRKVFVMVVYIRNLIPLEINLNM